MATTIPLKPTGKARKVSGKISLPGIEPFPFAVIEGKTPGSALLITAGVHGAEVCAIEAIRRIYSAMPADQINGMLVILPILNMKGFEQRVPYVMPDDNKNLNRQFPGNPVGTASERLAHWLMSEVYPHFDAYVDVHSGDLFENLTPFAIFVEGDDKSKKLAIATGLPYAVQTNTPGTTIKGAAEVNLSGTIIEVGGVGRWSETQVTFINEAVARVMTMLGMLVPPAFAKGLNDENGTKNWNNIGMLVAPVGKVLTQPIIARTRVSKANLDGFWSTNKKPKDNIAAGEKIGQIQDIQGNTLENIFTEIAGVYLYGMTGLWVNKGEVLFGIAEPIPE